MSYPDADRIGAAEATATEAARLHAEADRLLDGGGDLLHAVRLLTSAERLVADTRRLAAAELLAAAADSAYGHVGLFDWFHADTRDGRELRAAATKLLDLDDSEAGGTWRAFAELRTSDAERRVQSSAELNRIANSAGRITRPAAASAERLAEAAKQLNEALANAKQYAEAIQLRNTAPPVTSLELSAERLCNVTRLGPAARVLDAAQVLDAVERGDTYTCLLHVGWHAEARAVAANAAEAVELFAGAERRAEAAVGAAQRRTAFAKLYDDAAAAEAAAAEADAKLRDASAAWSAARAELAKAVERRAEAADACLAAFERWHTDEQLAEAEALVQSSEKRYEAIQQLAAGDIREQRNLAKHHFVAERRAELLADPEGLRAWVDRLLDDASEMYTAAIIQCNDARDELLGDSDQQLIAADAELVAAAERCDEAVRSYDEFAAEATAAHGEARAARGLLGGAGGTLGDAESHADAQAAAARSDQYADVAKRHAEWKAAEVKVAKLQAERCAAAAKLQAEWIAAEHDAHLASRAKHIDVARTRTHAESRYPNADTLEAEASGAARFAMLIADAASETAELRDAHESVQAARLAYEATGLADRHRTAEAQRVKAEAQIRAKLEAEWASEDADAEGIGVITS